MRDGEIVLYAAPDGATRVQLRAEGGTVWLTQRQMADLFEKDVRTVNEHVKNVFADGECDSGRTIRKFRIVQTEGGRDVAREVDAFNLDVILAVGYRVRSERGVQFRRWATTVLREYLVKGFAMDDERLKDPASDHFEELLRRIRDIRASEARFYQKVREILALSPDYDPAGTAAKMFYATIQNKMLHAVTRATAAELIVARADASAPNMGLTTWKGNRVRKSDVGTAKNYLAEEEIRELNLIVTMFLDTAELRSSRRQQIPLREWETVLDGFLASNDLPALHDAGRVSKDRAETKAHDAYTRFDAARRAAERDAAERFDELAELKQIASDATDRAKSRRGPTKLRAAKSNEGTAR